MALEWKHSTDGVDWEELSSLYRAAPLGDKKPLNLQTVFSNSMFKCFVYDDARLVGVGRALADGRIALTSATSQSRQAIKVLASASRS